MQNENVVVDFPLIGAAVHKASKLRRAPSTTYKPELGEGAILGELSLLYNLPRLATCAASEKSNVILYAISRSDFEEELVRSGSRHRDQEKVNEWAALLGEVRVLSSLVNAEIMELARMADGETSFAPNERVIQRGKVRELRQWYVIAGGTAVLSRDNTVVAVLGRGAHFGERSLLHGGGIAEVDVDAGERGMLCLCINGRILNSLQHCFLNAGAVGSTVEEYECYKAKQGALQSKFHIDIQMLRSVSVLGQGNFGMVTLAVDDKTGEQFALKRVSKRRVRQTKSQKYIQNERDLMSMVGSKFIIKLFCTYQDSDYVYMLQESALGGSLEALNEQYHAQKMDSHTRAWLSATQYFVGCVVMGLRHLHKRHIVHRDLKLGNILLTQDGSPKICDFGFARFVLDKTYTVLGTPEYMAPEIIEFPHAHNQLVDYWALGVFTFELLSGTVPWEDTSEEGGHFLYRIRQLQKQRPTPRIQDIYVPAVATDFVHNLLNQDPDRRLGRRGFNEVKNHNWFRHDFFSFEDLDKGGMKLPQIPVDLPGAQDLDPVTPSLLEAPEGDGVFRCLETNDWGLQNVLFEDNAMTALRHRKSSIRSDDVIAMTKSSKIVRITVDWKPSDCRGPVYFGLTSDPDDDHTFKSGCCVRIAPEEVSDPESPTRPSRYDVCSQDCGDNAITLSIENSDVAVYNCGQKVYSMSPNQKGIGSTFKSKAKVYGKVFLNGGSDTIEVYAYEEFPDDGSEWDKDFKMAGHFDASNGMKGSFGQLSKLGKLGESTASIASLGEESVKEDLYKSEAITEKDGESSIESEPEPESVGKDVLSLIGLLASIEKGGGETDLKQAIQAAYAAVESSCPNLAPLEPLLFDDMKPFLVSQQLLLLGGTDSCSGEQASSERFERFTQTTPRDEQGVVEQNRVMESGQVEELSWETLAAVPKQEMNKLFLESHVLEAVSLSSRAPSKCTTHPCTSRTEPDSSRAPSTCMTEPGPVEELPKSPGRPPRRCSSANVPPAICATRTFYLDALPKEIYRPRQLSQTAREELEWPQCVRRQASAPPRATSAPFHAPSYREILVQTRDLDSARSTSPRETLVQPRDLGVPTLVQSRDMGSARNTSQQREVLVRSLAQTMTAPLGSSSCSSLPAIRQRSPPGGVPDHIASRGKYPHLQLPIQARTGKGVAANNVQKPAPVSAARQHLMPIHPAVQGRVALARS
jgi:serine/threonine protein kinase/CRP-like cAMP-binding protein